MLKSWDLYEHCKEKLEYDGDINPYSNIRSHCFYDKRGNPLHCFVINETSIRTNYYVGVDWLIENKEYVYVAPKMNTKVVTLFEEETQKDFELPLNLNNVKQSFDKDNDYKEINYLKMYLDAATHPEILRHIDGLLFIDWEAPEISIEQNKDLLTPFLIVQYLNLLKQIVRKGLKKSYYKVAINLQNRIKGKILISENIKNNIVKNRLINTVCEYQEHGIDNVENRLLKKVLHFVANYIANHAALFQGNEDKLRQMIGYCSPAFENVSNEYNEHELVHVRTNAFFKEYRDAIKIGKLILKRFAYNISNASQEKITTPPFWIDMPRLFELYVYRQLLTVFQSEEIKYHFSTYGNELDFLITKEGSKMVVDAKYKLHYDKGHIHEDIRQVAGYARLNKVYDELKITDDKLIDCLIIYPKKDNGSTITDYVKIKPYNSIYKLGLELPFID